MSTDCHNDSISNRKHGQNLGTEQQQQHQYQQPDYEARQVVLNYMGQLYDKAPQQHEQQHFEQLHHASSHSESSFSFNNQSSQVNQASFQYPLQMPNEQQIVFATETFQCQHQEQNEGSRNLFHQQQSPMISLGNPSSGNQIMDGELEQNYSNTYNRLEHPSSWPVVNDRQQIMIEDYVCKANDSNLNTSNSIYSGNHGTSHQSNRENQQQQINYQNKAILLFKSHSSGTQVTISSVQSNDFNNNQRKVWNDFGGLNNETDENINDNNNKGFQETSARKNMTTLTNFDANNDYQATFEATSQPDHHSGGHEFAPAITTYQYVEDNSTIQTIRASSVPSTSSQLILDSTEPSDDDVGRTSNNLELHRWSMKCPASLPSSRKTSLVHGPFSNQATSTFNLVYLPTNPDSTATTNSYASTTTLSDDNSISSASCTSLTEINYNDLYKFQSSNDASVSGETSLGHGSFADLIENLEISPLESTKDQSTKKLRSVKRSHSRPRPKGQRLKNKVNGKLWEFIRDLLLDEQTNPSFIKWERREDGIFKFVQSDKVAKMWGERKQNPKMTYEKLSRAMRYYYKSKVLLPVFGRRLVYKFGPNATGWMLKSV